MDKEESVVIKVINYVDGSRYEGEVTSYDLNIKIIRYFNIKFIYI